MSPSTALSSQIAAKPNGTTFCLATGVYRTSQAIVLKPGQKLIGSVGNTFISGAKIVSATKTGAYWVITGQTSLGQSALSGTSGCRLVEGRDPKGMCVYRDQVFLDDASLWHVPSLAELSPGEFFWDYGTQKIYLADNPTGRKLELSVAGTGISGGAGVEIRNLTVEKFGNRAQSGAAITASSGWLIDGVEVRLNHGAGIHMGPGTVVRGSFIHDNGQLGIHGGQPSCGKSQGLVLENSELSHNNAAGYNWGWEGGATKWTNTDGLVVRNNLVHDNYGMGLWTDGYNINVLYADNVVVDNYGSGINHELGFAAVIRDNVVRGNGFQHPVKGDVWGSGIFVDQARDVEIYGNTVENNAAGITAVQEPAGAACNLGIPQITNLSVHDNTVNQPTGIAAGLRLWKESNQSYYTSMNNHWTSNQYTLGNAANGLHFYWANAKIKFGAWQSHGQL